MTELFKAKLRRVGGSYGVLIPNEFIKQEHLKEGEEIEIGIMKQKKVNEIFKLFGTAKSAKPFIRDRSKQERWESS